MRNTVEIAYLAHMAISPEALTPDEEPRFEDFHIGDVLRKARHHPHPGFDAITAAKDMAPLLAAELKRPVSPSTVNAWERGTNKPTRGKVRDGDLVAAYSKITGWPVTTLYARIEACRSSCFGMEPLLRGVEMPVGSLQLFDPDEGVLPDRILTLVGAP